MEQFLFADNDEDLVVVCTKIEMILVNSWFCKWDLKMFPSILIVNCNTGTIYEISKF